MGEVSFPPAEDASSEKIQASPSILQLNVDDFITPDEAAQTPPSPLPPGVEQNPPTPANYFEAPLATKTQQMPSPFIQNPLAESQAGPVAPPQPGEMGQQQVPPGMAPPDTHPSQAVPPVYPSSTPAGPSYYPALPPHSNVTMGMPSQSYGQYPPPSPHSNLTMGMPLPPQMGYPMYPAGMMPEIHSNTTMGMSPYPQPQFQLPPAFHSNSTILMPTMSEAEARARLSTSHAIPTASATAMALQNPVPLAPMAVDPGFNAQFPPYPMEPEREEDEGEELNILAVIIFGTLSITALGGLGMLILLLFTSPMSSG
jgi:hypothetical protein